MSFFFLCYLSVSFSFTWARAKSKVVHQHPLLASQLMSLALLYGLDKVMIFRTPILYIDIGGACEKPLSWGVAKSLNEP